MSDIVNGKIVDFKEDGSVLIAARLPNLDSALKRQYKNVLVELTDNRRVTDEQRKKAFALIGEISEWMGEQPPAVHQLMKLQFKVEQLKSLRLEIFSMANCDVTTAREYISYLIDFVLRWNVPSKVPLYELCDDVERYVYSCLMNKRCVVCGKKADLHHVDRIGMGRNRDGVYQIGMLVLPLCRCHHTEMHAKGEAAFLAAFHFEPIPLSKEIGKVYRLTRKNLIAKEDENAKGTVASVRAEGLPSEQRGEHPQGENGQDS